MSTFIVKTYGQKDLDKSNFFRSIEIPDASPGIIQISATKSDLSFFTYPYYYSVKMRL